MEATGAGGERENSADWKRRAKKAEQLYVAEREKFEALASQQFDLEKRAMDWFDKAKGLEQQLLQAQAAIEKHNRHCAAWELKVSIDATALAEHDAELLKPLEWEWTVEWLDEMLDLKFERGPVSLGLPDYMQRLRAIADTHNAALAQIKQRP